MQHWLIWQPRYHPAEENCFNEIRKYLSCAPCPVSLSPDCRCALVTLRHGVWYRSSVSSNTNGKLHPNLFLILCFCLQLSKYIRFIRGSVCNTFLIKLVSLFSSCYTYPVWCNQWEGPGRELGAPPRLRGLIYGCTWGRRRGSTANSKEQERWNDDRKGDSALHPSDRPHPIRRKILVPQTVSECLDTLLSLQKEEL